MTTIDTNVSNYTLSELMAIVNLDDLNENEIIDKTNNYINQFKTTEPILSTFFQDIQSQLLQYVQGLESDGKDAEYPYGKKEVDDRYENEYLIQSDKNEVDKITKRKDKIEVYGDGHVPMTRQQLVLLY